MNTHSLFLVAASSQYAERNDTASLSITGNLTLQGWVNFSSLPSAGNSMTFISKWTTVSNQRSYTFELKNNAGTYQLRGGISNDGTGESFSAVSWTPSTGSWYHVAMIYTTAGGANFKFVVNGAQQGGDQDTADWAPVDSTAKLVLGALEGASYSQFFDGYLDDWRIYSSARSIADVAGDYDIELSSFSGVAGYWKLNNDYTDSSGNSNDISPVASPVFSTNIPVFRDAQSVNYYAYFM